MAEKNVIVQAVSLLSDHHTHTRWSVVVCLRLFLLSRVVVVVDFSGFPLQPTPPTSVGGAKTKLALLVPL